MGVSILIRAVCTMDIRHRNRIDLALIGRYVLASMVDEYFTSLVVTENPWVASMSRDPEKVISTRGKFWTKGMQE